MWIKGACTLISTVQWQDSHSSQVVDLSNQVPVVGSVCWPSVLQKYAETIRYIRINMNLECPRQKIPDHVTQ